jgi:uncharacterized protein YndB with AHSA1/START domain
MIIEKSYVLPFPVPVVYAAWTSSDTVIPPATRMDIEAHVGGHYRLHMESPEFSARNAGVFLEVEPEKRLRYTWQWDGSDEVTEITVTFSASPEGSEVQITHKGFHEAESRSNHDQGWDSYMDGLIAFLESREAS